MLCDALPDVKTNSKSSHEGSDATSAPHILHPSKGTALSSALLCLTISSSSVSFCFQSKMLAVRKPELKGTQLSPSHSSFATAQQTRKASLPAILGNVGSTWDERQWKRLMMDAGYMGAHRAPQRPTGLQTPCKGSKTANKLLRYLHSARGSGAVMQSITLRPHSKAGGEVEAAAHPQ